MANRLIFTKDYFLMYFIVDTEKGIVKWIVDGSLAGTLRKDGYCSVQLNGKNYKIHRIVWCIYYDEWPNKDIDHKNRIRNDNAISNLRLATVSQNRHNSSKRISNTSGHKGVSYCKQTKKWRVQLMINNKPMSFGRYTDIEEAKRVYQEKVKLHHKEFACI